jgi:hypothetical protein
MKSTANDFLDMVRHPLKFNFYMLTHLPSAFFSGVRVRDIDRDKSAVSVPFKWFSKNPFRSTYFACLAMAAEMSTGLLAMLHTFKNDPAVSMLVVKLEAEYHKKATGLTVFTCRDGDGIRHAVEEAIVTHDPVVYEAKAIGTNEKGEVVAEFHITWSFRVKAKKA